MESFMPTTSWQTSLSAKLYNCVFPNSPGSPVASPSSPTLYHNLVQDDGLVPQSGGSFGSVHFKNDNANNLTNRSQLATTLLKNLEEYQHLEQFQIQNEFGTEWNDENANLELFNELSALEFTPPATENFEAQINTVAVVENTGIRKENESLDELSAEFQNILDSLPRTSTAWGEELIDFTDLIYSSPAETEGFLPTDGLAVTPIATNDVTGCGKASDYSTDESENEEDVFMEAEVTKAASELGASFQYLPVEEASSVLSYSSLSEDEDHCSMLDEKMLDALLVGNLDEAVTFLPGVSSIHVVQPVQTLTSEDGSKTKSKGRKQAKAPKKMVKKARSKKTPKIEKVIRKKEQNKTAALRYRMKKKIEVEITLGLEGELQVEHDKLAKQKEDLAKEITMVKQLLKAVFSNRKSKMAARKKY